MRQVDRSSKEQNARRWGLLLGNWKMGDYNLGKWQDKLIVEEEM